jgi:hypothetical protein
MPIHKKQKGGIIDDPKNCSDIITPIHMMDINKDSDVIYVGNELEGNKYHCYSPIELKDIILDAIINNKIPLNPINRQLLTKQLIRRIIEMYPSEFERYNTYTIINKGADNEDEYDNINDNVVNIDLDDTAQNEAFEFKYYENLNNFNFNEHDEEYIINIELYSTLDLMINKYPNTLSLLRENRDNPLLIKIAKILNQLYILDNNSIQMIKDTDLLDMIRIPSEFNIILGYINFDLIAIMIYRTELIGERINDNDMIDFLTNNNVDTTRDWIGIKIISIGIGLSMILSHLPYEFIETFYNKSISHMIDMTNINNTANVMLILSYNDDDINNAEYNQYIKSWLLFFNTPISNRYNELYYITNHEGHFINADMQGGFRKKSSRKIIYKRRKSMKGDLKTKSSKTKSSKKKSLKRKSLKRKSSKRKSSKKNRR